MNESQFTRDFKHSLEAHYKDKIWIKKMVGGPHIVPGIPDLVGCIHGRLVGFECKQIKTCPKNESSILWNDIFSQAQIDNLRAINTAGGYAVGIVHLYYLGRPSKALIITSDNIEQFNKITVYDINGLLKCHRHLFLTKNNGLWSINQLKLF